MSDINDFFAKKDKKKKTKKAVAADGTAKKTVKTTLQKPATTTPSANVSTEEPKAPIIADDGWIEEEKKDIDLSGLKLAEYVTQQDEANEEIDEQAQQEISWARNQRDQGIPDMQVDIGGEPEQPENKDDGSKVWRPSWREQSEMKRTNAKLNPRMFPSLQDTTRNQDSNGERAYGLKTFTEVRGGSRETNQWQQQTRHNNANKYDALGRR